MLLHLARVWLVHIGNGPTLNQIVAHSIPAPYTLGCLSGAVIHICWFLLLHYDEAAGSRTGSLALYPSAHLLAPRGLASGAAKVIVK